MQKQGDSQNSNSMVVIKNWSLMKRYRK